MAGAGIFSPLASSPSSSLTVLSEINVAYEGTFGDLSSAGAPLFGIYDDTDYSQLMGAVDGFTAINGNGVTVSPRDIFNSDSVPPSTSFTNLTTPGSTLLETPDEDYQTSPLFADNLDVDSHGSDAWYSLFPEEGVATNTPAPVMARTTSASSGNLLVIHPGGEGNRKRSGTIESPATFSPVVKHSDTAGVKAHKRDKPLPPIMVDPNNATEVKRARNTAAARKSRKKKVEEKEALETEIANLKNEVEHWKQVANKRKDEIDRLME